MHSRKGIVRVEGVIELGIEPVGCGVACAAVMRQTQLCVRRVICSLEISGVTCVAVCRGSREDIVDVARGAGQGCVHSGEGEAGDFEVVEPGVEPTVHGVTGFAGGGETERYVVENRGQEVLLVAGIASCREPLELPGSGVFVTGIALHHGMSPHERKAILVVLDRIQGDIPTLYRVAAFTIGAELPAMNVGVAIGAVGTYVFEDEAGVALGAANLLVHAAEGVPGGVMVELGNRTNGLPTGIGVAVLAGNGQRAVGIGHLGLGFCGIILMGTGRWLL